LPSRNCRPGSKAAPAGPLRAAVEWDRFKGHTKACPCCSVMTSVASPPRRPSILAIRSLWPVHVPTRDTGSSALNTGVETRTANAAEYKRAFMWGLHAWVLGSCTADVRKVLPTDPLAEGA